jgi:hypothetical protein
VCSQPEEYITSVFDKQEIDMKQAWRGACFNSVSGVKMSIDFHQTALHCIPEARTFNVVFYSDKQM